MTTNYRTDADHELTMALVRLASRGQRPRCSDAGVHNFWVSEQADEREQAVAWCSGCPVLTECGAAADANDERFGVWGAHDFTPRPNTRAERTAA